MIPEPYKRRFQWLLKLTVYLWVNSSLLIVGLLLCILATGWPQAVGTSLVASAIAGFLLLYQLRIDRQFDEARALYEEYGLLSILGERSSPSKELYRHLLERCSSQFDIIGISLSRFYSDLAADLLPLLDKKNIRMRILLLDPASPFVESRINEDPSPESSSLREEITRSTACYLKLGLKNLEVRHFTCTPTLTYQKIDQVVFAGSYFVEVSSGRQPSLMMRAGQPLAIGYERHFDAIWKNHSRPAESPSTVVAR